MDNSTIPVYAKQQNTKSVFDEYEYLVEEGPSLSSKILKDKGKNGWILCQVFGLGKDTKQYLYYRKINKK